MTNNSLRVKSKNAYIIEVNDNGDTIQFDLTDVELPLKYNKMIEEIGAILERLNEIEEIKLRSNIDLNLNDDEKRFFEELNNCYRDMRHAIDLFIGKGACQKIFGDNNWLTMFDDLFDALEPHLKAMGLKDEEAIKKSIEEKYSGEDDAI